MSLTPSRLHGAWRRYRSEPPYCRTARGVLLPPKLPHRCLNVGNCQLCATERLMGNAQGRFEPIVWRQSRWAPLVYVPSTGMTKPIEAIYEGGVLRPLEAIDLTERQHVRVVVQPVPAAPGEEDWLDTECVQQCAGEADERISLESVRRAMSKIHGSLTADFLQERADR